MLGDGLLASYLLALDQVSDEVSHSQFDESEFFSFNVKPKEAVDYFRRKKVVRSKQFNNLRDEARAAAFTVGGVYRDDVLEGFKEEITRSLDEGIPQRETIKRFRAIVDGAGHRELGAFHLETVFSPLHLEAVFRMSMREAHHCGMMGLQRMTIQNKLK